uniref:Putative secreted peptide n=1 Tax=Anopheles braziliensis TaxID=58242 RepID=A0A2M3ZX29_9DIPT
MHFPPDSASQHCWRGGTVTVLLINILLACPMEVGYRLVTLVHPCWCLVTRSNIKSGCRERLLLRHFGSPGILPSPVLRSC